MVKHKVVKFRWASWRKLRGAIPGRPGETFTDYLDRVADEINKLKGGLENE